MIGWLVRAHACVSARCMHERRLHCRQHLDVRIYPALPSGQGQPRSSQRYASRARRSRRQRRRRRKRRISARRKRWGSRRRRWRHGWRRRKRAGRRVGSRPRSDTLVRCFHRAAYALIRSGFLRVVRSPNININKDHLVSRALQCLGGLSEHTCFSSLRA